jgi:hypothetical protein
MHEKALGVRDGEGTVMGDYVDSHGIGRNFTPAQLQQFTRRLCMLGYTQEEIGQAWQQLQRVHDYLQSRVDLAYLDLYHNGESAGLYEEWQTRGDAMWVVRDALKGRQVDAQPGTRTITSLENMVRRVEQEEEEEESAL